MGQFHTGSTGRIANFGVDTSTSRGNIVAASTHQSNQYYDICIRRANGNCYICYYVTKTGAAVITQNSFGLSYSINAATKSAVNSYCSSDYIEIPNANTLAIASATASAVGFTTRFC